jgi:prepilin-type N-terminal cleavage/methylation domain-containing protein
MLGWHKRGFSRGDTIVEVMIVLAILGLAISICYATAHRSLLNARQAQENSIATDLAQSQIETIRALAGANDPANNVFQAGPFCTYLNSGAYTVVTPVTNPDTSYKTECTRENSLYQIAVRYDNAANTFKVVITWPDVLGEGNDTVTQIYKVYPGT